MHQPGKVVDFDVLLDDLRKVLDRSDALDAKLPAICRMLSERVPHYDWVGFYLVDEAKPDELVLGPYVGAPTEHTRIPFGRGICGQAAARRETFVVQDVSAESNYLSCSVETRSEIVVPILRDGRVLGELDIDSHTLSPFVEADRRALETLCGWIAEKIQA